MPEEPDLHYQTAVSVPDLLGFLPEDQRAVLAAMSGMDQDAPRDLAEVAALLKQEPDAVFFQASLAIRALYRELLTVNPHALRLVTSTLAENVAADLTDPGILSLQRLVPAVRAAAVPAQMLFTVANLWTGGRAGEVHQAGTRMMTPAGDMLAFATTPITSPGLGAQYAQVLDFRGQVWPEPGLYSLEVWLDGAPLAAYMVPVYEMRRQEPSNGAA
jgi:hypothetical protein